MDFPQYRKKFDNQSYYKVTSFTDFEEIQLIGKRFFIHNVHADKYFEILQVRDMIDVSTELYQVSNAQEYIEYSEKAHAYLAEKAKEKQ